VSALDSPRGLPWGCATRQHVQHLPDRLLSIGELWQRQVVLHLIAVAATLSLLEDVPGFGEIRDDGVRVALGDAEVDRNIAEAYLRVVGDAEQGSTVIGEEAPVGHWVNISEIT